MKSDSKCEEAGHGDAGDTASARKEGLVAVWCSCYRSFFRAATFRGATLFLSSYEEKGQVDRTTRGHMPRWKERTGTSGLSIWLIRKALIASSAFLSRASCSVDLARRSVRSSG